MQWKSAISGSEITLALVGNTYAVPDLSDKEEVELRLATDLSACATKSHQPSNGNTGSHGETSVVEYVWFKNRFILMDAPLLPCGLFGEGLNS